MIRVLQRVGPNFALHTRCLHQKPELETHFGFQTVREEDKWKKVHKVFADVAGSYDRMNDAMSLGIHRIWKDMFLHRLGPVSNTKLVDVAGGTGDIAFRFLDYVKSTGCHKGSSVTVCDINKHMLEVGQSRMLQSKHDPQSINWVEGSAEDLPFEDETFDAYTIAFGVRNCTRIDQTLKEAYRVLKPGGRYMCLEFSHVVNPNLQWLYDRYSFNVIPVMGLLVAGQWEPYRYLVESIRKFPRQEEFKKMIREARFEEVTYENLSFGVVAIHSGFKL